MLRWVKDQDSWELPPIFLKHFEVVETHFVSCDDLRIVGSNYWSTKQKQKTEGGHLIKSSKLSWNIQKEVSCT